MEKDFNCSAIHVTMFALLVFAANIVFVACQADQCSCDGHIMTCEAGFYPEPVEHLPANITSVKSNFIFNNYDDESWTNLTTLHLFGNENKWRLFIRDYSFHRLRNLQVLKVCNVNRLELNKFAFAGLNSLRELHFINIAKLDINKFILAWNNTVPKLEILVIDNIRKIKHIPEPFQDFFFNGISLRLKINNTFFYIADQKLNLHTLKLNNLKVSFPKITFQQLCKYRFMSSEGSEITFLHFYSTSAKSTQNIKQLTCNESQHLDMTNMKYIQHEQVAAKANILEEIINCDISKNCYEIFSNDMAVFTGTFVDFLLITTITDQMLQDEQSRDKILHDIVYPLNKQNLFMSPGTIQLKTVECKGNAIHWLLHPIQLNAGLEDLDLSSNGIKFMHQFLINPPNTLKRLVLADNQLGFMQHNYRHHFEILVKNYLNLQQLDISNNGITAIPYEMFSGNIYLTHLNISHNAVSTISFNLSGLIHLKYFGIYHNRLVTLGDQEMMNINQLVRLVSQTKKKGLDVEADDRQLMVDLGGNPLQCSCSNLEFITWIESSNFLQETRNRNKYLCKIEDYTIDIKAEGYRGTFNFCERRKIVIVIIVKLLECVAVVVNFLINRERSRQQTLRIRNLEDFITQIKRNQEMCQQNFNRALNAIRQDQFPTKFLAFISHSCEDKQFVSNFVYPKIEHHLSKITGTTMQHVCLADEQVEAGRLILHQLEECIDRSAVLICVVSAKFAKSTWCNIELKYVHDQKQPIILIMKEKVREEDMSILLKAIFNKYCRLKCIPLEEEEGYDVKPSWDNLCRSIIEIAGEHYLNTPAVEEASEPGSM